MTTHAIKIIRKMELQGKKLVLLTSDNCPQHRYLGVNQIKEKKIYNIPPVFLFLVQFSMQSYFPGKEERNSALSHLCK